MSNVKNKHIGWKEWCRIVQNASTLNLQEPVEEKNARIKKAKADYRYFFEEYLGHYATDPCASFHITWANHIKADPNIFAVIESFRESAKSVHCDIGIPMWLLINDELKGMIQVGKNNDDACNLLADIQAELQYNQKFINDFGVQFKEGNWEEGDFETSNGIGFVAIGRGQSPRGIRNREKRPNYCSVDDIDDDEIINNIDRVERVVDWLLGSLYGALDLRASRFVMVGNRIADKSILAHVVGDTEPDKPKRKGIYHSKICATTDGTFTGPSSWPEKFSSAQLQLRFERMGYFMALREYFHRAVKKGKIFKAEWIHWDRIPKLQEMDYNVVYFDPSYKAKTTNDFKAIKCWGKKGIKLYCWNAFVKQSTITEAVKWLYDLHESIPEGVSVNYYMEEVFLQDMFYEDFESEAQLRGYYLPISGDTRKKPDKFSRIQAISPLWERGMVFYDIKQKANYHMQTGIDQTLGFQKGASIHDDGPDADEGAISILQTRTRIDTFDYRVGKRKNRNFY